MVSSKCGCSEAAAATRQRAAAFWQSRRATSRSIAIDAIPASGTYLQKWMCPRGSTASLVTNNRRAQQRKLLCS
eukprot:6198026-Pleurochrysis_carterae.AAC.1